MTKILQSVVLAAVSVSISATTCFAQSTRFDKFQESGQQGFDAGDFVKAESNFNRALKELDGAGTTNDQKYATTLKRLAQSCRHNQKYGEAGQYLDRAITVCKAIGLNDPEVNTEYAELSKVCKIVDLDKLGPGSANTLKSNSAVITVVKADAGYAVRIQMPARFEKALNSGKIDQMGLEKECTFNLNESADGTVQATDIKCFKIH